MLSSSAPASTFLLIIISSAVEDCRQDFEAGTDRNDVRQRCDTADVYSSNKSFLLFCAANAGRRVSGKEKRFRVSRAAKAGLQFPVGRIGRYMRDRGVAPRIGAGAPVYLAGVLEYLVAELLELSGNAARDNKRARITPRHILLTVRNDDELNNLFGGDQGITIAGAGKAPSVHSILMMKRASSGRTNNDQTLPWVDPGPDN